MYETESYKFYVDADGFYSLSKYFDDGVLILSAEDDVANRVLGGGWHIPSYDQWAELIDKCTWEETTIDGCGGWKATGPNGNSIFFPYAGIRADCYNVDRNDGGMAYWTNEAHESFTHRAYFFGRTREGYIGMDHENRYYGFSIRPVKDK